MPAGRRATAVKTAKPGANAMLSPAFEKSSPSTTPAYIVGALIGMIFVIALVKLLRLGRKWTKAPSDDGTQTGDHLNEREPVVHLGRYYGSI